jgi:hypothetical protein
MALEQDIDRVARHDRPVRRFGRRSVPGLHPRAAGEAERQVNKTQGETSWARCLRCCS